MGCVWRIEICHLLGEINAKKDKMYFNWLSSITGSASLTARPIEFIANFQLLLSLTEDNNPILIFT